MSLHTLNSTLQLFGFDSRFGTLPGCPLQVHQTLYTCRCLVGVHLLWL